MEIYYGLLILTLGYKPLGYSAREKNDEFQKEYAQIVNKFTLEFSEKFITNGEINWDALVRFNSASDKQYC